MITNHLLEAKDKAQKLLDEQANHDLRQYFKNSHRVALELAQKYGLAIQYDNLESGYLKPACEEAVEADQ